VSSNWQDLQCYCPKEGWVHPIEHMKLWEKGGYGDCPASGGKVLVEVNTGDLYCTACGRTWKPEMMTFNCLCGRRIPTQFQDSTLVIGREDRVLGYRGDLAYILTASGTLVIVKRTYLNIRGCR
jgi:hypothetical protein